MAQGLEFCGRRVFLVVAAVLVLVAGWPVASVAQASEKVIFDTDFAIPPQDDGTALMLALKSPELKILGVTTVAGNTTVQQATSDALKVLEVAGRTDIPVYRGFNRPWLHQKTEFATTVHGKWWSDEPAPMPPGGFAKKQAEEESAVSFLIRAVNANPHEITIIAIGPLTNVATAIRQDATFAKNVKTIAIMGGAIASLPDGGGNITPNAEFNFWVDPEAAQVVIRSGIPIVLTPLNVTSKTDFSKAWYDKIVAVDTPLTRFLKETMGPWVAKYPDRHSQMYDQLTVASLVDPSLVKAKDLFVDIDINHGPDYGTSLGAERIWEGGEGATKVSVQYDVDANRFAQMFVQRITSQ
ncbi:MAG TPA: nucleoside hydrolase [Terriglobales bacterium]